MMLYEWITSNCGSGIDTSLYGMPPKRSTVIFIFIILSFDSAEMYSNGTSGNSTYSICTTPECYKIAKRFQEVMNFSVSPCDDFAEFVCGDKSNALALMSNTVLLRTVRLLQEPEILEAKSAVDSARALYQGCKQSVHVDEDTLVHSVTRELRNFGGMPLIPDSEYDSSLNWMTKLAMIYRQLPINAIFGFEIIQDLKHVKPKYMTFSHIEEFGIPKEGVVGSDSFVDNQLNKYRILIRGFVCFLRRGNCAEKEDGHVNEDIYKLVDFEHQLALLTWRSPVETLIWRRYKKRSIKFLMEKIPEFDWLKFVQELFIETAIVISKETEVVFMDMEYFIGLTRIINQTDPKTIANYLGWRVIQEMPVINTYAFRKFIVKFAPSLPISQLIVNARTQGRCARIVKKLFPHALGKLYVERHFRAKDKEKIEEMTNGIGRSMKFMIIQNTWMDESTKLEALKKVKNMDQFIAYPSWISDEKVLEEVEGLPEPCHKDNYISSLMKTYHYRQCKELSEINRVTRKDRWRYSAADMRAYYNPLENSLYAAAGISQPPFYYTNSIDALVYGAQGFLMGHEIAHAFDKKLGKAFNGNGMLTRWWSNSTAIKFDEEAECFVKQYGSIIDKRTNLTLNGHRTLTENLADNVGLQNAYQAYMMTPPTDSRLPGLEHLTHAQLFFIAFGRASCQMQSDAQLREEILHSDHAPGIYRIAIPPRNLRAFAEAFKCPKGSPMNPDKRCNM